MVSFITTSSILSVLVSVIITTSILFCNFIVCQVKVERWKMPARERIDVPKVKSTMKNLNDMKLY
jgi:hypothetical protein